MLFSRDGAPERGIVIGRTASSDRFIANTPPDRKLLESMTKQEFIGTKGRVAPGDTNTFTPA